MKMTDRAWLAGIVEGEGYIGFNRNHYKKTVYTCPVVEIGMQDKDVIAKAAKLFGKRVLGPYGPYGMAKRPSFQTQVFASDAIRILQLILPWLGKRRACRAREVLRWKGSRR